MPSIQQKASTKRLGTKWFTFYTKIRPWLSCISLFSIFLDFSLYTDVYMSTWWRFIYFCSACLSVVLCLLIFIISFGDYTRFVRFVKYALFFECSFIVYQQSVIAYINSGLNIEEATHSFYIALFAAMVWYCLNINYFEKRIVNHDVSLSITEIRDTRTTREVYNETEEELDSCFNACLEKSLKNDGNVNAKTDEPYKFSEDDFRGRNTIRVGDRIKAHTHAKFLNYLLDKNYTDYRRCTYKFDAINLIWMIRLDNKTSSTGWRNALTEKGERVVENYVGAEYERLEPHKKTVFHQRRYIFDILEIENKERMYVFRGVFEFAVDEGSNDYRVWKRVSSTANFEELMSSTSSMW